MGSFTFAGHHTGAIGGGKVDQDLWSKVIVDLLIWAILRTWNLVMGMENRRARRTLMTCLMNLEGLGNIKRDCSICSLALSSSSCPFHCFIRFSSCTPQTTIAYLWMTLVRPVGPMIR